MNIDHARSYVTQCQDDLRGVARKMARMNEFRYPTRFNELKEELEEKKEELKKARRALIELEAEAAQESVPPVTVNVNQLNPVLPRMLIRGKRPKLHPDGTRVRPEGWNEQRPEQTVKPCPTCKAESGQPCMTTRKNTIKRYTGFESQEYKPVIARIVHVTRLRESDNG